MKLLPGAHQIEGRWRWDVLPEHVTLPQTIGVMTLVVNGQRVESPNWDAQGLLWLQRPPSEQADQDQFMRDAAEQAFAGLRRSDDHETG